MSDVELVLLVFFFLILIPWYSVKNNKSYYVNYYGVWMVKDAYLCLKKLYSEKFVETLNEKEYKLFKKSLKNSQNTELKEKIFENISIVCKDSVIFKVIQSGKYVTLLIKFKESRCFEEENNIIILFSNRIRWEFLLFKQIYIRNEHEVVSYKYINKIFKNGLCCSFKTIKSEDVEIVLTFKVIGKGKIYIICDLLKKLIPVFAGINYLFYFVKF